MKVGVSLPISDEGFGVPSWSWLAGIVRELEEGGIESVWVADHMTAGVEKASGCEEAGAILAALAVTTSSLLIGSLVFATSFRPAPMLAKMATTIDRLSNGRFVLGVGCGWNDAELTAFGFPTDHRVPRFAEAVHALVRLLEGHPVSQTGRWTSLDGGALLPSPRRHIPVLVAATGPTMLQLAARFGDGWNSAWYGCPSARFRDLRDRFRDACLAVGRDPATVEISIGLEVDNGDGFDRTGRGEHIRCDPAAICDALREWDEEGVAHVQINSGPRNEAFFDAVTSGCARFRTS